jgi:hypothetical protein
MPDNPEDQEWAILKDYLISATPSQLHYYAATSNYDGNYKALALMSQNPQLEKATALLIHWYLAADYFARVEDIPDFAQHSYELIREIQDRYSTGFYKNTNISFDPSEGSCPPGEYEDIGPIKRAIPDVMYSAIFGSGRDDAKFDEYDGGLPISICEKISALYG